MSTQELYREVLKIIQSNCHDYDADAVAEYVSELNQIFDRLGLKTVASAETVDLTINISQDDHPLETIIQLMVDEWVEIGAGPWALMDGIRRCNELLEKYKTGHLIHLHNEELYIVKVSDKKKL